MQRAAPESPRTSVTRDMALEKAEAMHAALGKDKITFGLYVRVGCGLHAGTDRYVEEVQLMTKLLRRCFPGSPFLSLSLLKDPKFDLHRDLQNDWLPNLVIELKSSPQGGAWVENPRGDCAYESDDGSIIWGTVLRGSFKLSARSQRHKSHGGSSPRHVLVAWTPAAWRTIPQELVDSLLQLGFVMPTEDQSLRARESTWGGNTSVQVPLSLPHARVPPDGPKRLSTIWPSTALKDASGLTLVI